MIELSLDLVLDNGESYDDTITLTEDSLIDVEYEILNFVEGYFNEGYTVCDPRYYSLSDPDYEKLALGRKVRLNGLLKVQLSKEEG